MKRQLKTLIVAGCILAVLVGAVLVMQIIAKNGEGGETSSETETYSVISEKTDDLEKIEIKNANGEYVIERNEEGDLGVPEFEKYPQSTSNLTLVSGGISVFSSVDKITAPEDLSVYGLASPAASAKATFGNGNEYVISVGSVAPYSSSQGYYAMLEGDENVYVLDASTAELLLCDKMQYISLVLNSTTAEEMVSIVEKASFSGRNVTDFELVKAQVTYDGKSYNDSLKITDPYDIFVDDEKAETVLTSMLNMYATSVEKLSPTEAELTAYGLSDPAALLDITYDEGENLKIILGDKSAEGYYYIMNAEYDVVFRISEENISNWVGLKPASVMMFRPILPPIYLVSEMHVSYNGESYVFDITADPSDTSYVEVSQRGVEALDVDNFKKFYAKAINYSVTDTMTEIPTSEKELTITYVYDDGGSDTVEFYDMGSRRYQVVKNGKGRFLTTYSEVKVIEEALGKLLAGEPIAEIDG